MNITRGRESSERKRILLKGEENFNFEKGIDLFLKKVELFESRRTDFEVPKIMEQADLVADNYKFCNVYDLFQTGKELISLTRPVKVFSNTIRKQVNNKILAYPKDGIFEYKDWPEFKYLRFTTVSGYNDVSLSFVLFPISQESYYKDFLKWMIEKIADFEHSSRQYQKNRRGYMDRIFLAKNTKEKIINHFEIFLNSRNFYKEHKIPWKLGILLYGPPGNGKTLLIKSLGEHFNLQTEDLSDYINRGKISISEKEREIDEYNLSRETCYKLIYHSTPSPKLYYLEDLDKKVFSKGGGDIPLIPVGELLQTMDGVDEIEDVIIMATTNHRIDLVNALVARPGRFDFVQEIGLPDPNQIKQLIDFYNVKIGGEEKIIETLKKSSMAFTEKFLKSCILTHKKTDFEYEEVQEILNEIREHAKLADDYRKEGLGF